MHPEIQDEAAAEQREYALAKGYTEARVRALGRRRKLAGLGWFGAAVLPILLAAITPWLAAGPVPIWMQATARLGEAFSIPFPLRFVARQVFGSDRDSAEKFLSIAGTDLLCILAACFFALHLLPWPRLRPKSDGMQIKFLHDLTKGFRLGKTRNAMRIGGAAGGVVAAPVMLVLILGSLHFVFLQPMQEGTYFADAGAECLASPDLQPESGSESPAPHCLVTSAWHMAWRASLTGLAVPLALLIALNYAIYPVWLALDRPTRRAGP